MTTPADIITRSLRTANINGVGQTPSFEDMNDGFVTLNNMLSLWSRRRWLVYHETEVIKTSTGALSYSIGPAGDFVVPRVDRILGAFARLTNSSGQKVDYGLSIVQSREDYNQITMKELASFPMVVFLDSNYPAGTLYFWPVPSASFELHVTVLAPLTSFATLTDVVSIPPEYMEPIDYNLALRLVANYGGEPTKAMVDMARSGLATLRSANLQIPTMSMPAALAQQRQGSSQAAFIAGWP
jgi:hypothetical protein